MLSPIQLIEYKILRIHFDTRKIEGESAALSFQHGIAVCRQGEKDKGWLVRLDVQFMPETEDENAPYIGEIAVVGIFELSDEFPEDKAEQMVHMNGGAVLFGIVREMLNSFSARGIHGPIMLPTVDPRSFLLETERSTGSVNC